MRVPGLLLLLLVAGGLAYGLWTTRERAAKEQVPVESLLEGRRLFDADRLVLQRAPDARALHFAHGSPIDPFLLVEPIEDLASRAFLESVRGTLETAQRFLDGKRADVPQARLSDMGLVEPRARIEVRYPDKTFAIDIGLEGPLHQDLYVAMDGYVYRTGIAVYGVTQANVDDVRERLLIQSPLDDVRRLVLRRRAAGDGAGGKEETIELERVGMAEYRLRQPVQTTADTHAAVALLSFLGGMAADAFLGELNPMPAWDVQIEMEGSRGVERITLWKTPQGLIGRQEPRDIAFTIRSADYTRTFEVPVAELRGRVLVPLGMTEIGRIEIQPAQGEHIQLRRGLTGEMQMFQPIDSETDPGAINALLQATQNLGVVEFVDAAPSELGRFGLDRGFLTLSLHRRDRETDAVVLHFGKDDGDSVYVKREAEPYVAKAAKEAVDVLRLGFEAYVTRKVGVSLPRDVREIRYTPMGRDPIVMQRDAAGKWSRLDRGADVSALASELLDLLNALRGKRVLDAHDPGVAAELAKSQRVAIAVGMPGQEPIRTLVLHDRGRDDSGPRPAWIVSPRHERVVVELGIADTAALLAPLSP